MILIRHCWLTVSAVQFEARRSRKKSVPVFPAAQARFLQETVGPVVMERILAIRIWSVDGYAFETFDSGGWKIDISAVIESEFKLLL